MSRKALNEEQIEHYRREGYLVLPEFFGRDVLERIDRTIDQITEDALRKEDYRDILEAEPQPLNGRAVARRIYNPFDIHEEFRKMAMDERLLDCVESIVGPNINIHHSKLNMKPPRVGSVVEWHQDLAYFPHTNDDLISLLVYLDEATEENGCLRVLPRHHTHFFEHDTPEGKFAGMITENLENGRFGKPVKLEALAGSVIFMHCITPHSSLPNRSDKSRRTLIFEYRAADSFPIYFGDQTKKIESKSRLARGKPSRFARFGGPNPLIPNLERRVSSLYDLQTESKARLAAQGNPSR